jgi:hypothetical protein
MIASRHLLRPRYEAREQTSKSNKITFCNRSNRSSVAARRRHAPSDAAACRRNRWDNQGICEYQWDRHVMDPKTDALAVPRSRLPLQDDTCATDIGWAAVPCNGEQGPTIAPIATAGGLRRCISSACRSVLHQLRPRQRSNTARSGGEADAKPDSSRDLGSRADYCGDHRGFSVPRRCVTRLRSASPLTSPLRAARIAAA